MTDNDQDQDRDAYNAGYMAGFVWCAMCTMVTAAAIVLLWWLL